MASDYEAISVVAESLKGIVAQGDKIIQAGQNLSDVKIAIGVAGGVHADFCKLVDKVKEIDKNHSFGYSSLLESLGNFKVGNWSELVGKSNLLLPIVEQFLIKLEPTLPR